MLRSLFSGISGLRSHQTLMDVVSNNIANVSTTGFKTGSVVFEDTLSQVVKNAAAPTTLSGGTNPAQIGLGAQLGAVTTNFSQGSAQTTSRPTDLMIQGDGFFLVRNGSNNVDFTRAGAFTFDTNGTLVNSEGMQVQGWTGMGTLNTNTPPTDIILPANLQTPPTASTKVTLGGNITAGTTTPMTVGVTVYDGQGVSHTLSLDFASTTPPTFDITVTDTGNPSATATGSVAFTATGANDGATTSNPTITLADGTNVTIDLKGITQFGGPKTMSETSADGSASGTLQQFQIANDGSVVGVFSNGQKLTIAQIALANFNNPAGLEKIGNTSFRSTYNSGLAQVGIPGTGGRGELLGGSLEMSNVDLAAEFTNLIIAQRGFQANSRVITTSDQMLQDLVDLKR